MSSTASLKGTATARLTALAAQIQETEETAKIFGTNKYSWHTYNHPKAHNLTSVNGKHSTTLKKGSLYGIRPATSKKGMMRLVVPHLGLTKVFSIPEHVGTHLKSRSKAARA